MKTILLITFLSLFTISSDPEPPVVLDLDQAITIGLEHNYGVRIQREISLIASNNRTLGTAGFLPSLELSSSRTESVENSRFQLRNDEGVQENRGATSTNTAAGVGLSWTLFDGTRMFVSYERLGELEELSRVELQSRIEDTVQRIIQAYVNAVRVNNQLKVLEALIEVTRERIEIAQHKRDLGSGSDYDLLEARTDLNADLAALMREKNRLQEAKIDINELLGRRPDEAFSVADEIPLNESLHLDDIRTAAFEENTHLRQARIDRRVAELELRDVSRERFPEVELNSGYRYNRNEGGGGFIRFNETDGFSIGITARLNIFDGFDTSRRIQNARIIEKTSRLELEEMNHLLETGLVQVWTRYQNSLELVRLERSNVENVGERMEIALERFREGVISALEFREAQRAYMAAESRLIEARFDAKIAETELLRLSGSLAAVAI